MSVLISTDFDLVRVKYKTFLSCTILISQIWLWRCNTFIHKEKYLLPNDYFICAVFLLAYKQLYMSWTEHQLIKSEALSYYQILEIWWKEAKPKLMLVILLSVNKQVLWPLCRFTACSFYDLKRRILNNRT